MIRISALAAIAALALGTARPTTAGEFATFQPLWVVSATASGQAACGSTALLTLPAGWRAGDAAVVLLTAAPVVDALRDPLVAARLHERAAVVEMVSAPGQRCTTDGAEDLNATSLADPLADLFGALRAVTRDAGAGLVVAIGYGAGATVAIDAVGEGVATRRLGIEAPRFAAGAALGNGSARFALGPTQQANQRASARLSLLCEALGHVVGGLNTRDRTAAAATADACHTALAGRSALVSR